MRTLSPLVLLTLIMLGTSCTEPAPPPVVPAEPSHENLVERGRYLVEIMGCHDCHSPKMMTPQGPVPDPKRLLSGHPADEQLPPVNADATQGWVLFSMGQTATVGPWGTSFSGNITSDETGIGNWTEAQFKRALTQGSYKGLEGSRPLLPPMPWQNYRNMDTEDVKAIFAYLKSTTPVHNVPPAPIPPSAQAKAS